jgi:hypothetical protein
MTSAKLLEAEDEHQADHERPLELAPTQANSPP